VKISGSHLLPLPVERAYQLLQDPDALAGAIPGCQGLEKVAEDEYRMQMKMALASISGAFEGKVRIADRQPPNSFRLIVEGTSRVGFVKGDGVLNLKPSGDGTEVSFEGDANVGGTMAAVGQRMIDGAAKMMIKKFFEKLVSDAGAAPAS
jgi:carbon monoxide dehydrogenase subunit G